MQILQENGDLSYGDLKIRRWDKSLEKPQLDYSEFFMEDVGQVCIIVMYVLYALTPSTSQSALEHFGGSILSVHFTNFSVNIFSISPSYRFRV